jgi:hypothetical protein
MTVLDAPVHQRPSDGQPAELQDEPRTQPSDTETIVPHVVDPVRSAAGRLGAQRIQELVRLGRAYEEQHGLTPGRQRRRQLIQLGRR